jgi:large subunit ribosomal protein L19
MDKLRTIEQESGKKEIPKFNVGDTVRVLTKTLEADNKVRLHPFEGVVIAKTTRGAGGSFTVRKVSYGEGIERVFPLYSPNTERIDLVRSGKVRHAKLYYLRSKVGKRATKIEDQGQA